MAERPDGKSARTERVVFTRPAAERISRVVRTVEAGERTQSPLVFGTAVSASRAGASFSLARYTATVSWTKGTVNQVFLATANTSTVAITGATATAINLFALISGYTGSTANTTAGVLLKLDKVDGMWLVTNAEV